MKVNGMRNSANVFEKDTFDMDSLSEVNFKDTLETFTVFVPTDAVNLSKTPEDYDYDMEMSHNTFFWDELLPTLLVYCLTFVLGLVGNFLIIFTIFRYRKMKSTTNVFLASLASSDLLLILFCIPVKGFQRFVTSNQTGSQNKSENLTQTSCETFRKMKSLLDSFLIKEADDEGGEEEGVDEEIMPSLRNGYGFRSPSETTFVTKGFMLSPSASDRLSLLENNLIRSETKSDLEVLMSKLSEEIRRCSLFFGQLKGAEGNAVSLKLTASDSKIELSKGWGGEANNVEGGLGGWFQEQTVFPVSLRHSRDRVQSLTGNWAGRNKNQIHFGVSERTPTARTPGSLTNLHKTTDLHREGSNTSLLSYMLSSVPSVETQFSRSKKAGEVLCCDDCKRLRKKIQKLEKELEKMERRMPFYPVEYQNSIKSCLESLKATSETVLKRLRSCAKMRYLENQKRRGTSAHYAWAVETRPQSAPTAAVHKVANKHLSLRSSNSDYQLQVGMELTMENVDPATGKKLHPEVSQGYEQEGNVQCRMFKSEGEPVLLMDTDFTYNPKTGMLFKPKEKNGLQKETAEVTLPLREVRGRPSVLRERESEQSRQPYSTFECLPMENPIFVGELCSEKTSVCSEEETTSESVGESTSQITDDVWGKAHESEETEERRWSRSGRGSSVRRVCQEPNRERKQCEAEEDKERRQKSCRICLCNCGESVSKKSEPDEERGRGRTSHRRSVLKKESPAKHHEPVEEKENRKRSSRCPCMSGESVGKPCEAERDKENERKSSRRGESRSIESVEKCYVECYEEEEEEKEKRRRSRRKSASSKCETEEGREHEKRCSCRRKSMSRESLEKLCEVEEEGKKKKKKKKKSSRKGSSKSREADEKSCELEEEKPKKKKSRRKSGSKSRESSREACEQEEERQGKKKGFRESRSKSKECSRKCYEPEEDREDERKSCRRRISRSRESVEVWCEMAEDTPRRSKGCRKSHFKSRQSPKKYCESGGDSEKEEKGCHGCPFRSGALPKKYSKKEEEREKDDKSYRSSSTSKDCLRKHDESEEETEKEKKSPRKSLSKSKEGLRKIPGSLCSTSEVRTPEEPTFESKKLEEIAMQLSELKELALESKKQEECGMGSRKTEKCSSECREVVMNVLELKQLEKSTSELSKQEQCASETGTPSKNSSELKIHGNSVVLQTSAVGASEFKLLGEGSVELKKEQRGASRPKTPGGGPLESRREKGSGAGRKKDEKAVSRIPTRRKTTPSSPDPLSQKSSRLSLVTTAGSSLVECYSSSASSKILVKLAKLFSFTWTFGFFLCKWVHYMQNVSAICSVLTLTAMSLERYYAIVHPMKAQYICTISQARRIITATWISAFLLAVPILFAQVHLKVGMKVEAYWCVRDWDNRTIWRAHELYMMLLILVIPTGVMAVAYTAICWEIWEVIQRRHDMTSGKGHAICRKPRLQRSSSYDAFPSSIYMNNPTRIDSKRKVRGLLKRDLTDDGASVKQVIKMLVAVVVIYVICWGPMLIDNVLQAYGILSHIRMGWLKYMGTAFHLMAYFNSCINPIIYGFMSKNFRESFRKTLCCVRKKPKTAYRSFSLSQTRNTSIRYAESSFGRTVSIALPV